MDENIFYLAGKVPVMFMGAPGIGKTARVVQFAERIGADLVDIRLSAETPGSFEGKIMSCHSLASFARHALGGSSASMGTRQLVIPQSCSLTSTRMPLTRSSSSPIPR